MLPGIGGVEYLVIAALIIIFVGPKELPTVLRAFGRWWTKIKNFSREFRSSINEIAAILVSMKLNHLLRKNQIDLPMK